MLFTHTIRRKMMFQLALVLVMMLTLFFGSLYVLYSYRCVVDELRYSLNKAPRKADLAQAITELLNPLLKETLDTEEAAAAQQREFMKQLADTREQIGMFRRKLDALPPEPELNLSSRITDSVLQVVADGMQELEKQANRLTERGQRANIVFILQHIVNNLQVRVAKLPDLRGELHTTLKLARRDYGVGIWLICVTSIVVILLFAGLVRYGYRGIFAPISELHRGASRVAQGDFDYRVQLPTRDEMSELADSFNQMTTRFQDITCDLDRQVRERSKQLVRSERLAGIGFLAAGVAHEINNPLSAMSMAAEALEGRIPEPDNEAEREDFEVTRQYLSMIQREAFRCQQITSRLLEFSRGQGNARSQCDLTAIVNEVLMLVGHMSRYQDRNIEFSRSTPCYVQVNGPEIQQVVLNLVANALESMNDGGTLRIGITEQTDQVTLTTTDDGCGMTSEVIENLFEPFFTQRKDGKGTGLGLSISHRIVSDHGGTIEATSEGPGRGSTFNVSLPKRATRQDAA